MIAIKLSAFQFGENVVLHPVTVLDVIEEADISDVDPVEHTDRSYWERKTNPASLAIMDKIVLAIRTQNIDPRLTYNRHHIAMGTTGYNYCWFHPRKTAGHCHIEFRAASEAREAVLSKLQAGGIDASPRRADNVSFSLTSKSLEEHLALVSDVLKDAEIGSKV